MRLDKFLSHHTDLTRSQARQVIRRGRVRLAGETCRDPGAQVGAGAVVEWNGEPVSERGPRYLMLHKPVGHVSVTEHDRHPTILDLLEGEPRTGLHAAGRLDLSASGLVLVTDDGDWSHRLTSPHHRCPKIYLVTLAAPLTPAAGARLTEGVMLHGEARPTLPAEVVVIDDTRIRLTIFEGRYHQVKRMLAAVGNRVTALHREAIGAVELDPALGPGAWRPLTPDEVQAAVTAPAKL